MDMTCVLVYILEQSTPPLLWLALRQHRPCPVCTVLKWSFIVKLDPGLTFPTTQLILVFRCPASTQRSILVGSWLWQLPGGLIVLLVGTTTPKTLRQTIVREWEGPLLGCLIFRTALARTSLAPRDLNKLSRLPPVPLVLALMASCLLTGIIAKAGSAQGCPPSGRGVPTMLLLVDAALEVRLALDRDPLLVAPSGWFSCPGPLGLARGEVRPLLSSGSLLATLLRTLVSLALARGITLPLGRLMSNLLEGGFLRGPFELARETFRLKVLFLVGNVGLTLVSLGPTLARGTLLRCSSLLGSVLLCPALTKAFFATKT